MPTNSAVDTIHSSTTNILDGSGRGQGWNTPIPYLFGGLILMFFLIAVALLILACSNKNSSSVSSDINSNTIFDEKGSGFSSFESEKEPNIVVVMAGDLNPTYLANPLPSPIIKFDYTQHIATNGLHNV